MGKNKATVVIDGGEIGYRDQSADKWAHARRLVKLVFGSQSIMFIAVGLMTLAVLNGDIMRYFTNGALINFNELLLHFMPEFAYPIAMIVSGIIIIGPAHYYAAHGMIEMIIIILIVFIFTGFFLGHMFKHPLWAFASGFIVMISFIFSILGIVSIIDYIATQTVGMSISSFIYGMMAGIFESPIESLFIYTILENGAVLGICGAMWGSVFMQGNKSDSVSISMECADNGICEI